MLEPYLRKFYETFGSETAILITLAMMLVAGFLVTRITKLLRLPNVSGFIIAGILIGPSVFGLITSDMVSKMSFISDIALAFIAFGVGRFFKIEVIKRIGPKAVVIALFETIITGIVVAFSIKFIFNLDWMFSFVLGAVSMATAPSSTTMTIKQYHARGEFVDTLLPVVALDNAICLFVFSVVVGIASKTSEDANFLEVFLPVIYNIALIVLGMVCGIVLSKLLSSPKRSRDNRLILVIAMLLGLSGLCAILKIAPLLSCMMFGATYINLTRDKELYHQVDNFTPPVMSLFFIVSGMRLKVDTLFNVGGSSDSIFLIAVVYFIIRITSKYGSIYLGCKVAKTNKKVKRYLGLAMLPAAGVAIGLASLAQRVLPSDIGDLLMTVILASAVLYELIGPVSAKRALFKADTIAPENINGYNPRVVDSVTVEHS